MNMILEMAATGSDRSIRFLAEATIRDSEPDQAARELIAILAIQCPTNGYGALKLMNVLVYLHRRGV
jgi:hypothetical protein